MAIVDEIKAARERKELKEREGDEYILGKVKSNLVALRGKLPALREAYAVYVALSENGFTYRGDIGTGYGKEYLRGKGYFASDSWYHWEGFGKGTYYTQGGGANGASLGISLEDGSLMLGDGFCDVTCKVGDGELDGVFLNHRDLACMAGGRHTYCSTPYQVNCKVKMLLGNADAFCAAVKCYADKVVKG